MARIRRNFHDQELDRNELQLSMFACFAILILAAGLALLMYPAVFSEHQLSKAPQIAFVGFCCLSVLLIAYIVERQLTICRLRREMELDRKSASDALARASDDLLLTMPDLAMFKDRLPMEFRRAAVAKLSLSVFIIGVGVYVSESEADCRPQIIAEVARTISQSLREEDSIYHLGIGNFGIILPGVDYLAVRSVATRLSTGLASINRAGMRFSFRIDSVSYPQQASTVHDMEALLLAWLPEDDPNSYPFPARVGDPGVLTRPVAK